MLLGLGDAGFLGSLERRRGRSGCLSWLLCRPAHAGQSRYAGPGWLRVDRCQGPFEARKQGVQASRWYDLKLLAYGLRLVAICRTPSDPSSTVASSQDEDCIRNGRVGLSIVFGRRRMAQRLVVPEATQMERHHRWRRGMVAWIFHRASLSESAGARRFTGTGLGSDSNCCHPAQTPSPSTT